MVWFSGDVKEKFGALPIELFTGSFTDSFNGFVVPNLAYHTSHIWDYGKSVFGTSPVFGTTVFGTTVFGTIRTGCQIQNVIIWKS